MERKQFTFYRSFFEGIEKLPTKKEKLQAFDAICRYAFFGEEPDAKAIKPSVATLFEMVKPILQTANKRAQMAKNLSDRKQLEDGMV